MTLRTLIILSLALGGCAGGPSQDLPTCDGSARRPANPGAAASEPMPAAAFVPSSIDGSGTGGCA